jgi:hypothetical protein
MRGLEELWISQTPVPQAAFQSGEAVSFRVDESAIGTSPAPR